MPILKRVIKRRQTRRKETQRRRSQKRRTQRRGGGPQEELARILKGKVETMNAKATTALLSQKNSARMLLERGIPLQLPGKVGSYSYLVNDNKVYYMTNKNTEPQELGLKKELLS
jgi:hypothetical protein